MAAYVFSNPCVAADLFAVAPVFDVGGASPVDEDRVLTFLELAEGMVDRTEWGTVKAPHAVCLLAAHFLHEDIVANATAPSSSSTSTTITTSIAAGPISKGKAVVSAGAVFDDEALATTPWGRRFIAMRKTLLVRGVF